MFPISVTQASTSFFDVDLVACVACDGINHVLDDTGVFRCKSDTSTRTIDKYGGFGVEAGVAVRPATGGRLVRVVFLCLYIDVYRFFFRFLNPIAAIFKTVYTTRWKPRQISGTVVLRHLQILSASPRTDQFH